MSVTASERARLVACPECDLVYRRRRLPRHQVARCARCGAAVFHGAAGSLELSLALSLTALVLFLVANAYPLLALRLQGHAQTTSLLGAAHALAGAGMWSLAAVVLATVVLAPALEIGALLYVLAPLRWGGRGPGAARLFRWLERVQPWAMVEVFLLGVLVSVVKLSTLATVQPGVALYALATLVFVVAGMVAALDADAVWERLGAGR